MNPVIFIAGLFQAGKRGVRQCRQCREKQWARKRGPGTVKCKKCGAFLPEERRTWPYPGRPAWEIGCQLKIKNIASTALIGHLKWVRQRS